MNTGKPYRVLEHLLRELDKALVGMCETERIHLLAELRRECWMRLLQLDEETRKRAEWEATSPLKMLQRD